MALIAPPLARAGRVVALLAPGVATAAFFALVAADRERAEALFTTGVFWLAMPLIGLAAGVIGRQLVRAFGWPRPRNVGLAAALTLLVALVVTPRIRIVSDETNLILLGKSFAGAHLARIPNMVLSLPGEETLLSSTSPDKPMLFSLAAAALHMLSGYRLANNFALNLLAFFGTLLAAGLVGRKLPFAAAAGLMLLVAAEPIIVINATSANYDLLSAALTVLCGILLMLYLERRDGERLNGLVAGLCLLANARHETALYLPVVAAGLIACRALPWPVLWQARCGVAFMPLALLPRAALHLFYAGTTTPAHHSFSKPVAQFSAENLGVNFMRWIECLTRLDFFLPYAAPLLVLGTLAAAPLCLRALWRWRDPAERAAASLFLIASAAVGAHFLFLLVFWAGNPLSPMTARYFIVPLLYLTYCLFAVLQLTARGPRVTLIFGAVAFALYFPVAWRNEHGLSESSTRKIDYVYRALAGEDQTSLLLVADFAGRYTAKGYGAIDYDYFAANRASVLGWLRDGRVRDVYLILNYDGKAACQFPELKTDVVARQVLTPSWGVCIAKVVL